MRCDIITNKVKGEHSWLNWFSEWLLSCSVINAKKALLSCRRLLQLQRRRTNYAVASAAAAAAALTFPPAPSQVPTGLCRAAACLEEVLIRQPSDIQFNY
jgi:hypothetical protein